MRCPVCSSRTKIIRTRPDPDDKHSTGYTRLCRRVDCATIFNTNEVILTILEADEKTILEQVFSALPKLSRESREKVSAAISGKIMATSAEFTKPARMAASR